jgi:hypothetical protein
MLLPYLIRQPCSDTEIHKFSREASTYLSGRRPSASQIPLTNKRMHSTLLLEKLTAAQLTKKSPEFY